MPLHPQSQSFLDAIAEQGGPRWHEMPPVEGREQFSGLMGLFGTGPVLERVEDITIESNVKVRFYSSVKTSSESPLPVVMYFHGGGWVLGNVETHDSLCRNITEQTGYVVASVEYGLAPECKFPGPLNDCYAATKYVFENADHLGIDKSRIAVAGDSAGGNLAAAVSLKARDEENGPSIGLQILIYPVIEANFETDTYKEFADGYGLSLAEMKWFWQQYLEDEAHADQPLASVAKAESLNGLPATHVITAQYDVLRSEGERFASLLEEAGVETTTKQYDGMLHGFVHLQGIFDDSNVAIQDIANLIKKHFA